MGKLSDWLPFKRQKKSPDESPESDSNSPVVKLQDEVNRLFDDFFNRAANRSSMSPISNKSFFGDFSPATFSPSIDIEDEDNDIKVTAELPGLSADDIDLQLKDGNLYLKGQKSFEDSEQSEGFYRTERAYGGFQRIVPMPHEVDAKGAEANFDQGVLTVKLPKTDKKLEGKKVEISS